MDLVLMFTLVVGCVSLAAQAAEDFPENQNVPVPLVPVYLDWAEALEQDSPGESAWQFPFGAPVPDDLSSQELKIVLALRRLVLNGNLPDLEKLVDHAVRGHANPPVQMQFWLAYALKELGRPQASLTHLQSLLLAPGSWLPLEVGQRVWVMTKTADLLFLWGNRQAAVECYTRMSDSPLAQLNLWGNYQLAGMNFLDRDFALAQERYTTVCEADQAGTWREHACAMASVAERLSRIRKVGEDHGDVAAFQP